MTNLETAKREMSKVNFTDETAKAVKKFTDACYDLGISAEEAQRLMYSKQGLDMLAKLISKNI